MNVGFFDRVNQMCVRLETLGVKLKKPGCVQGVFETLARVSRDILITDKITKRTVSNDAIKEIERIISSLEVVEKILSGQPDDEVLGYICARLLNYYSGDFSSEDLSNTQRSVGILLSRFYKIRNEVEKIASELPKATSAAGIENGKKALTVRNEKVMRAVAEMADRYFDDVSPADVYRDRDDTRNVHGKYFDLTWAVFDLLGLRNRDGDAYHGDGLHALISRHPPPAR